MAGDLTHQIVVRVTDEMHAALEADAEANGRTVAQSVRFHLRAVLQDPAGRPGQAGQVGAGFRSPRPGTP